MTDKNLEKILEFFKKIRSPAEYVLKNKYDDPTGEDLMGEEIDLAPYAVIHKGGNLMLNNGKWNKKFEFENRNNFGITSFDSKNCKPVEGVLDQLKSEGYEIIYPNS